VYVCTKTALSPSINELESEFRASIESLGDMDAVIYKVCGCDFRSHIKCVVATSGHIFVWTCDSVQGSKVMCLKFTYLRHFCNFVIGYHEHTQ
jgi:hypothetical protein